MNLAKILSTVALVVTFSQSSYANLETPKCFAYHQTKVGQNSSKVEMTKVNAGNFGDLKLQANLEGHQYEMIWHIDLDTFYMTLREGNIQRAFSTARIPTENHNDTGLDVTFLDGHRRFISCAF